MRDTWQQKHSDASFCEPEETADCLACGKPLLKSSLNLKRRQGPSIIRAVILAKDSVLHALHDPLPSAATIGSARAMYVAQRRIPHASLHTL